MRGPCAFVSVTGPSLGPSLGPLTSPIRLYGLPGPLFSLRAASNQRKRTAERSYATLMSSAHPVECPTTGNGIRHQRVEVRPAGWDNGLDRYRGRGASRGDHE